MSRMFLVWSLLFGLALVGADWYVEHGRDAGGPLLSRGSGVAAPSDSQGLVTATDDGTPMPRPPK